MARLVYIWDGEDCSRIIECPEIYLNRVVCADKREVKDGLQMEIHILFSEFSQESHDLVDYNHMRERKTQYACDRARFAGSQPVLIPLTTILTRIEETGV